MQPFLKWAGGKRRLLPLLRPLLPEDFDELEYIEPFLGGGALFFDQLPNRAHLSDINGELIDCYKKVRSNVDYLIKHLSRLENVYLCADNSERLAIYKGVRDGRYHEMVPAAARFIFLNKTCFNGLWRVNSKKEFNVAHGKYKKPVICDKEALLAACYALESVDLWCGDYKNSQPTKRHFVYLDPPYVPISATANFTSYSAAGFGEEDQVALRDWFASADRRGAKLMLSNSYTPRVMELYKDWNIDVVTAPRTISRGERKPAQEVVVRNYE